MNGDTTTWLDVLTNGRLFRDWFSLIAHFFLGLGYFIVLTAGFAFAIATSVILIGIPMLLFMLATTRVMAALDRQLFGALLQIETPAVTDNVDVSGANLGERLGLYLGSGTTWRSAAYLLFKLPLGIFSISAAIALLPVLALEMLVLGPLIAPARPISVTVMHWLAVGLHKIPGWMLPTRKRKRDTSRLETVEQEEAPYYLEDDGEIIVRKRRA